MHTVSTLPEACVNVVTIEVLIRADADDYSNLCSIKKKLQERFSSIWITF